MEGKSGLSKRTEHNEEPAAQGAALPEILTKEQAFAVSIASEDGLDLDYTQQGEIRAGSFKNYCEIVERDGYLRGRLRFNLLDGRPEAVRFFWNARGHPVRDEDIMQIRRFIDERFMISNEKNIREAVEIAARQSAYHPIRESLSLAKWDGVERIKDLFPKYLGAERSEYTQAVTELFLGGAIKRITNPGCKFDYCIILADTKQGSGKSTICRLLALQDEWFTDQIGDLGDGKKAFEAIRGKWVVELGELLAVRKTKDVEAIKAFITRQADRYRDPYGVYAEDFKRQCVFIGTTNRQQFLPEDMTGNRRFIPLRCDGNRQEAHPMADEERTREYIRQCYAEAITKKLHERKLVLDHRFAKELEAMQAEATQEDSRVGMVQQWLDQCSERYVCTRMLWDRIFAGTYERPPQKFELRELSEIMNLQVEGWKPYGTTDHQIRFKAYGKQRAWERRSVFRPVEPGENPF